MEQKSSNNKIILIIAGIVILLILCCCITVAGLSVFLSYRTRKTIEENNSYLKQPLQTGYPTITPTFESKFSDQELKDYTTKIMNTFKKNGSKDIYDNYSTKELKDYISYDLYRISLDPYQDYDSFKLTQVNQLADKRHVVDGTIAKANQTYYFSLYIEEEDGVLKASDFIISKYNF